MEFTYTLTASFITERELSEEELNAIVSQVAPQIQEPVNEQGDNVDYEIKLIACEIGSLSIKENEFNCGACGQMISVSDQDENGFHDPELCDANDEIEGE